MTALRFPLRFIGGRRGVGGVGAHHQHVLCFAHFHAKRPERKKEEAHSAGGEQRRRIQMYGLVGARNPGWEFSRFFTVQGA